MKIIAIGKSDTGRVRKNNEDSYLVDDGVGLYAVADGIGGHEGGEVASRMAIEGLSRIVRESFPESAGGQERAVSTEDDLAESVLDRAFAHANIAILRAAAGNPALVRMGTTMTALFLREGMAHLAHVGDSRAYRFRAGVLAQISDDHSVVAEQIRAGLITPGQARHSTYRHVITRALGLDSELTVDHRRIAVEPGDTFLLCTDGLTEMVDDAEIGRILLSVPPRETADLLVRAANDRGGVDNITVVVVHGAGEQ